MVAVGLATVVVLVVMVPNGVKEWIPIMIPTSAPGISLHGYELQLNS